MEGRKVYTIGHSTRTLTELVELLRENDVTHLVDVRVFPRSRTTPQFNGDTLPDSLGAERIAYRHLAALGGRRHRSKDAGPSPNSYWRVAAFQHYADYAATSEFRTGLADLLSLARDGQCAIMCAEAVWWRCHRRIIADYLIASGLEVEHIMGAGKVVRAQLTPGACVESGGTIVYPAKADT